MSAQGLLRDIVIMVGGAVCLGLPMALVIIWVCSWREPSPLARIPNRLAPNHKQVEQRIIISIGMRIAEGFEVMHEPFKYDPELME
jgi:hypothetical protein